MTATRCGRPSNGRLPGAIEDRSQEISFPKTAALMRPNCRRARWLIVAAPRISPVLRTWENAPAEFRTAGAVRRFRPPPQSRAAVPPALPWRPARPPALNGPGRTGWGRCRPRAERPLTDRAGWGRLRSGAPLNAPPPCCAGAPQGPPVGGHCVAAAVSGCDPQRSTADQPSAGATLRVAPSLRGTSRAPSSAGPSANRKFATAAGPAC